jgi:integrase/recombinase XerD
MASPKSRVCGVRVVGPLAPFTAACIAKLGERGYTPLTIVNQLRQVARLSRWLEASDLTAAELTGERVDDFVVFQRAGGRDRGSWSRPGLSCVQEVLREQGVMTSTRAAAAVSPTEVLIARFQRYLCSERSLSAGTVRGYVRHADRFVTGLAPGVELGDVTARVVTAAVLREAVGVSVSAAQNFVAGLRAFLRFCFIEGLIGFDLSQAALPVTGRRRSSLPRGIAPADARALLESCDRRSMLGRRDYALLVVLLRLGLRRGEVVDLRLDDIDWRMGELVVRGKGNRQDRLPLPVDVGEAIASYLRRGRPASDRRELFLRGRAPFDPIAAGTVASTVRRACRRAGIAEVGSHRLRHTVACEMVAADVALTEIAQVLRHRSLQSTAIYARVDLDRLRRLAQPWPKGGSR